MTEQGFDALALPEGGPWSELRQAASAPDYAQFWLALQARQLPGARLGVVIFGDPDKGGYAPLAVHPKGTLIGPDLARAAESCLGEKKGILRERPGADGSVCIAWPVMVEDRLLGVAAFELAPGGEAATLSARRLQWGAAWLELLARRRVLVPPRRLADAMDMAAALAEAPNLAVGLRGMVSELALQMAAEWVALGRVGAVDTVVDIPALSHRASAVGKTQTRRALQMAMQEALDQRETLQHPGDATLIRRAHEELAEVAGPGPLVSLPIAEEKGRAVAVLTLQRGPDAPGFAPAEVEFLRLFCAWIGPIMALKAREEMGIFRRLAQSLHKGLSGLLGARNLVWKVSALAFLALVGVLASVDAPDRVTAQARLEGSVQRAVTSPIIGYVAEVRARAGDVVTKGQVLARLDDRDLKVELARWQAERDRWAQEYASALAKDDRALVGITKARIAEAQSRLDLVEDLLRRIEITSPIDGLVVAGDLDRLVGAPVQRGDILYEVAPLDDYRVMLDVAERDLTLLREGQGGMLLLTGLTEVQMPLTVTRITPVSHAAEGRNVFRVEAALARGSDLLRPGMQGWAKVEVGQRRLLTILTERAAAWIRMQFWRWLP